MRSVTAREKIIRRTISDALERAFNIGSQRVSDGSCRPVLTKEDCDDIAALTHQATANAVLGKFGFRTIHGGSF